MTSCHSFILFWPSFYFNDPVRRQIVTKITDSLTSLFESSEQSFLLESVLHKSAILHLLGRLVLANVGPLQSLTRVSVSPNSQREINLGIPSQAGVVNFYVFFSSRCSRFLGNISLSSLVSQDFCIELLFLLSIFKILWNNFFFSPQFSRFQKSFSTLDIQDVVPCFSSKLGIPLTFVLRNILDERSNPPVKTNGCGWLFVVWSPLILPCGLPANDHPHRPESHRQCLSKLFLFSFYSRNKRKYFFKYSLPLQCRCYSRSPCAAIQGPWALSFQVHAPRSNVFWLYHLPYLRRHSRSLMAQRNDREI